MNFKKAISFLCIIVCGCATKYSGKTPPPSQLEGAKLSLPTTDQEKLISPQFMHKLIKFGVYNTKAAKMLRHLIWENENMSNIILKCLVDEIGKASLTELKNFFDVIAEILLIPYRYFHFSNLIIKSFFKKKAKRIKYFMLSFLDMLNVRKDVEEQIPECRDCVIRLQRTSDSNEEVRKWLKKNESKWQWISKWYKNTKPSYGGYQY
jgi:hypothetical protein